MAALTKNSLFKLNVPGRDKAETTTSVARSIADAEAAARQAKTARLRKLRLQKEAAAQAGEAVEAVAEEKQKKPAKAKRRSKG
jgi:hypothetical protein